MCEDLLLMCLTHWGITALVWKSVIAGSAALGCPSAHVLYPAAICMLTDWTA